MRVGAAVVVAVAAVGLVAPVVGVGGTVVSAPTNGPLVWLAPLPRNTGPLGYDGSKDFMSLFRKGAPWKTAAGHVQVFKLYGGWVAREATDAQLKRVVSDLKRRRLAIAFEASPLQTTDQCGATEGFAGPSEGTVIAQRLKLAGATVKYVALDEPFYYGGVYDGPGACHWSAEKVASEVAVFVRAIRRFFPKVVVGDIEPLPSGVDPGALESWMDAYRQVTGARLRFFHLDLDFSRLDWPQAARRLESSARSRGIPFGIIYDGTGGTDAEWTAKSEERFTDYEAKAGGRPDQVIFQSWEDHPDYVLPETKSGTFTWLVNRYFRTRTALTLELGPSSAGGRLSEQSGKPIGGARVAVSATQLDGPGVYAEYTLSGAVPADATHAVVGFRVNTECGCSGPSDFALYEARYSEDGGANRVMNPRFDQGWDGWGPWGDASFRLEPSDRGGTLLHVVAQAGQVAAVNSADFPVRPGAPFTVTFAARVSPLSMGSGYLDVVFLTPSKEAARREIPLAPDVLRLGSPKTDAAGAFSAPVGALPTGHLLVEAWYRGDSRHFPSYATVSLPQ